MNPEQLFVLCLATWRISNLLVNEDGPFDIFVRLRSHFGIRVDTETQEYYLLDEDENVVGKMLMCVWCTSLWVALALALFFVFVPVLPFLVCLVFSMSAVACLLDNFTSRS